MVIDHPDQFPDEWRRASRSSMMGGVDSEAGEESRGSLGRMFDAGCGTGLAGVAFRSLVRDLVGADLSSKMVDMARSRDIYDDVQTGDLVQVT